MRRRAARRRTPHTAAVLAVVLRIAGSALRVTAVAASVALLAPASAQEVGPASVAMTPPVTAEVLNAKIREVEASSDLDPETKDRLNELYRRALSHLETARAHEEAAEGFISAETSAPEQAKNLRDGLERIRAAPPTAVLDIAADTPLSELEQRLLSEKANLAAVSAKLAELEKQLEVESARPTQARHRLTEARLQQDQLLSALEAPPRADESPQLAEARRWATETQLAALSAETRMLDQELLSQPVRLELMKVQRDSEASSVERIGARVDMLEATVANRRRAEAEAAQAEAEQTVERALGKHPLVQELAERNAALSEQLGAVAADLERVTGQEDVVAARATRIEERFRGARQMLEVAGISQVLGQVLLEERRDLPDARDFRRSARIREDLIAESALRQLGHDEERRRLRDRGAYVDGLVSGLPLTEQARLRGELEALAEKRRELLDKAIATDSSYLQALGELDFAERQLLVTVEAYGDFLASRLLWVRTAPPPGRESFHAALKETAMLVSPANWMEVLDTLGAAGGHLVVSLATILAFLYLRRRAAPSREALRETGRNVGRIRLDRFSDTLRAVGWSLLLAIPGPVLAIGVAWPLRMADEATDFARAVSQGLLWLVVPLLNLNVFRIVCEPGGLAERHFGWSPAHTALLRRELRRLLIVFAPATFVTVTLIAHDAAALGGGLARAAFAITMVVLALFFHDVLGTRRGVLCEYYDRNPRSGLARLRLIWPVVGTVVPLALGVLAFAGYLYTAGSLARRLIDTMWLLFGLVIVHQVVTRWLLVTRRRLALRAAIERREAQRAARLAQQEEAAATEAAISQAEEREIDLVALSEDSRKLLSTALVVVAIGGLWAIWVGVLPAFAILDEVSLWYHSDVVAGEERRVPITLADVGLAILIAVIGFVGARRLPALLEIAFLQRLAMTPGGRYAVTTLSRYVIAGVTVIFLFNVIGGNWSQVQWLIAALGVGIGFGLQEIVANFISGLILLFERPIRVGDIVTVGDTDGVVTRIQIRATTIRNWDQKELLVPNKEFVTGRLLNWTLSDAVTRLVITVGIAYGSDVSKALALLTEAAQENEQVLRDPKPVITFEGFGDNALTLVLRCYVNTVQDRLPTTTALHLAINEKFEAAGIVIAFPQRDVHLDTSRPLDIRIHRGQGDIPREA